MRVQMSYHKLNNLAVLINVDLAVKIGQGILSTNLMDIDFYCYLTFKVNGHCVY